jgi:transcriptional regulator with XRE-family HTH domain
VKGSPKQARFVALLPFTKLSKRRSKVLPPKPDAHSLGEHVKYVRQIRKLMQAEVAAQLGVSRDTICRWEIGRTSVPPALMPAVLAFLGYDPIGEAKTLPDRMRTYRRREGLTVKAAASRLGVNGKSWTEWENGRVVPRTKCVQKLELLLGQ